MKVLLAALVALLFAAPAAADTLTVAKNGTGSGTVTSSPAGINCGPVCSFNFPHNSTIVLSAATDAGSVFSGCQGNHSGWQVYNGAWYRCQNDYHPGYGLYFQGWGYVASCPTWYQWCWHWHQL